MYHLTGVRIRNLLRYRGEHELALTRGLYAVTARDEDDPDRSNSLGKSTLGGVIGWCLDGEAWGRRTLDEMISEGEDEGEVNLEFSDGLFVARVRRKGKTLFEVTPPGSDKPCQGEKAQALLDGLLGVSRADRLATSWAEQGDLARLLRLGTDALTELVERWLGLQHLAPAGDDADDRFAAAAAELRDAEQKLRELEGPAGEVDSRDQKVREELVIYEAAREAYAEATVAREVWTLRARRAVLFERIRTLLDLVDEGGKSISLLKKNLPDLDRIKKDRDAVFVAAATASDEAVRFRTAAVGEFDGKCPAAPGFECPARASINGRRIESNSALEKHLTEVYRPAMQRKAEAERLLSSAQEKVTDLRLAEERQRGKERELERAREELHRIDDELAPHSGVPFVNEKPPLPDPPDRGALALALALAEQELARAKKAASSLEDARSRAERCRRDLAAARLAAAVLGPEGVRRRAADRGVAGLAREANRILSRLGSDLRLDPRWGSETQRPASVCPECGRAFPASARVKACECGAARGNKVRHALSFAPSRTSGGALDLGGLALRAAGFALLQGRGANLGTAWFDEPCSQLDRAHRTRVGAGLRDALAERFEQVFVTSHDSTFVAGAGRRIVVIGSGKWSRIEVER